MSNIYEIGTLNDIDGAIAKTKAAFAILGIGLCDKNKKESYQMKAYMKRKSELHRKYPFVFLYYESDSKTIAKLYDVYKNTGVQKFLSSNINEYPRLLYFTADQRIFITQNFSHQMTFDTSFNALLNMYNKSMESASNEQEQLLVQELKPNPNSNSNSNSNQHLNQNPHYQDDEPIIMDKKDEEYYNMQQQAMFQEQERIENWKEITDIYYNEFTQNLMLRGKKEIVKG